MKIKRVWGAGSSLVYWLMCPCCSQTATEIETLLASTILGKQVRKQLKSFLEFAKTPKPGRCFRTKAAWVPGDAFPDISCQCSCSLRPSVLFSQGQGLPTEDCSLERLKPRTQYSLSCPDRACPHPAFSPPLKMPGSLSWGFPPP